MKIVLVNPFQGPRVSGHGRIYNRVWTPLDLANSAALLRRGGHDVAVIDANAERIGAAETARRAVGFEQAYVTSTSLDRWQCPCLDLRPFCAAASAIRAVVPELYVMGSHGTVRPAEMLEATGARAVVRGEPEGILCELAARKPLSEIKGITWKNGLGVVHNPDAPLVDMKELPLPALDLLPMPLYRYEIMGDRFALFELSRGCASQCAFCLLKTYGHGVRQKPLERLQLEIEEAITAHGVRKAYFIDLEFTVLRRQVAQLCDWLVEMDFDFEWCCQTRFDLVDDELLAKMNRAKCTLIHFGVEGGSDEALARMDKGLTMAQIRAGMTRVKRAGIRTACFFMMGFPECAPQDIEDIRAFARELAPDYPQFHIATPYPGTRLHDRVKNDPKLRFSDDSLFPEAVEGRFCLEELKRITRRAYLDYYLRPGYIWGRLTQGGWGHLVDQASLLWSFLRAE